MGSLGQANWTRGFRQMVTRTIGHLKWVLRTVEEMAKKSEEYFGINFNPNKVVKQKCKKILKEWRNPYQVFFEDNSFEDNV